MSSSPPSPYPPHPPLSLFFLSFLPFTLPRSSCSLPTQPPTYRYATTITNSPSGTQRNISCKVCSPATDVFFLILWGGMLHPYLSLPNTCLRLAIQFVLYKCLISMFGCGSMNWYCNYNMCRHKPSPRKRHTIGKAAKEFKKVLHNVMFSMLWTQYGSTQLLHMFSMLWAQYGSTQGSLQQLHGLIISTALFHWSIHLHSRVL